MPGLTHIFSEGLETTKRTKETKTAPKDYLAIKNWINLCEAFVIFVLFVVKNRYL
jgi:hypothetical protein